MFHSQQTNSTKFIRGMPQSARMLGRNIDSNIQVCWDLGLLGFLCSLFLLLWGFIQAHVLSFLFACFFSSLEPFFFFFFVFYGARKRGW